MLVSSRKLRLAVVLCSTLAAISRAHLPMDEGKKSLKLYTRMQMGKGNRERFYVPCEAFRGLFQPVDGELQRPTLLAA